VADGYGEGLDFLRRGEWFAAHEAFEEAWRTAEPGERDFLQGLVHVAVAWYHADVTGRRRACESQLEKAARRLAPYAPAHRGVDVTALLASVEAARGRFPELARPRLRRIRARG
jgi:predicted metal-dependent hydrolase